MAQTHKLVNAIFVHQLPNNTTTTLRHLSFLSLNKIPGVQKLMPHSHYKPQLQDSTEYIGSTFVNTEYCAKGKGVKAAVLDTGIDYTHQAFSLVKERFLPIAKSLWSQRIVQGKHQTRWTVPHSTSCGRIRLFRRLVRRDISTHA